MAYGTVNADVIGTSVAGSNLGAGNATNFKNRIINGAMVIDQRNAGASVTPINAQYLVDRWFVDLTQSSKFTAQQNAGSVTPPAGFINYLGTTSSSAYSVTSTDYFLFSQQIEGLNVADLGWGTANAKTVTLSAWVYSSLTGTFGGSILNSAQNRSYPFSYSISSANTWTQISITIAGDTSGTWLTTNGTGIIVRFGLGVGTSYSGTAGAWAAGFYVSTTGATSIVGTSGATFYITGVQLEVGSSATGFDFRDYGRELILCQRYYEKSYLPTVTPGTASTGSTSLGSFPGTYTTWFNCTFQTNKRTNPTMTAYSPYSGASGNMSINLGSDTAIASFITGGPNQSCVYAAYTGNASLYLHFTASAEL